MTCRVALLILAAMLAAPLALLAAPQEAAMLQLHARGRRPIAGAEDKYEVTTETLQWDPARTALVVVDMWDDHWCKGAARRVGELAEPLDRVVAAARDRGVLIVHCPSTCVDFYNDSPARRRALEAPPAKPPMELASEQRWGTAWDYPDEPREPPMPIDDSDMGCDCPDKCEIAGPWTRQIATIDIDETRDAITDNGQELVNLFAERGVDNVIICGVHLNMCVLGRPFAIRQLVKMGKKVVLVRDMTDAMYDHRMPPHVDHFTGVDLVVEHVEKYWCPSIESTDLMGGQAFRFAEDARAAAKPRE